MSILCTAGILDYYMLIVECVETESYYMLIVELILSFRWIPAEVSDKTPALCS